MAARMEVKPIETQRLTTAHFVHESRPRLLQPLLVRVSQINQITVMRQDALRRVTGLLAIPAESLDLCRTERRCLPLALILRKEGESGRPDAPGIQRGILGPARRTYVCSKIFHTSIVSFLNYSSPLKT